jgi:CRP-like cAMP-binding protein
MAKTVEQEMLVLSSSKTGLIYLTINDWVLIADKASRVEFKKGAVLVEKGRRSNGIYLILQGSAKVQIGLQRGVAAIKPGEICGDMSFLEDAPVSASVVAETDLAALHLDRSTLNGLFELFPHLASRFYRSLATNLSRRLRGLIGSSSETTAAVAQKQSS